MSESVTEIADKLLDSDKAAAFLADRLPGEGPFQFQRHVAGHSCETFFVRRGEHEWVLRRPPLDVYLPTAHDVEREYRVLDALSATPVRAPKPLVVCEDISVIGAPFYVMQKMDGYVIRDRVPDALDDAVGRARIGEELVDALVELHSVDFERAGLTGFGKPTGYLDRQLRRWSGQLQLATSVTEQARKVPEMWAVRDWLGAHVPETARTSVVHGDYKLDNVMVQTQDGGRLTSILDWEMATLGDPLADVGWMISRWSEAGDQVEALDAGLPQVTKAEGFPTRGELVSRYSAATGTPTEGIGWYVVLALWKLACLLEGSFGRHLMGTTDDPLFAQLEEGVPALAKKALQVSAGDAEI